MEDNVVQMPSKLDRLATRIEDDMKKRKSGEDVWAAATLDLCVALAEARAEFPDNQAFGDWFKATGLNMNKTDRAAAIAMGKDPVRAKTAIEKSEHRSIQLIYNNNFRVHSDMNTPTATSAKDPRLTAKTQHAINTWRKHKAAGTKPSIAAAAKEAGVGAHTMRKAVVFDELLNKTEPPLAKSDEARLDAYKRKLDKEIDEKVDRLVKDKLTEILSRHFNMLDAKVSAIEKLLVSNKPIFERAEFTKLLMVIHPDNSASTDMRAEVFKMVNSREMKLQRSKESEVRLMKEQAKWQREMARREAVKAKRAETKVTSD